MTLPHSQSVIRHLVSANVLLKEQLDKQTDEKKSLHKKLLKMEHEQSEKDRLLASKQKELNEVMESLKQLQEAEERILKSEKDLVSAAVAFKSSMTTFVADTPSRSLTSTPKSTLDLGQFDYHTH